MNRLKQLIFKDGYEAYVSLFIVLVAVGLTWSVVFIGSIKLKVGDQVNANLLVLLNLYANGFLLFIAVAILFGIAAFSLAIGSWKRLLTVCLLLVIIGFCGLMGFAAASFGTSNSYAISTSTQYGNYIFKVIHAYRNGDMIAEADYVLLQCDISGSACQVTDKFDDYRYDAGKSKSVSFYVEPSDNALYLKVGDETKLVSKV